MSQSLSVHKPFPYCQLWDSEALLNGLCAKEIRLPNERMREQALNDIWLDLCTEYDSRHFQAFLRAACISFSSEFQAFIDAWAQDEERHTAGSAQIYSLHTGETITEILYQASCRKTSFERIRRLLIDEFHIVTALAVDEISTALAYRNENRIYDGHGHPKIGEWLRLVSRDEIYHFINCLTILKRLHLNRLQELPALLEEIVKYDANEEYRGTFIFDRGVYNEHHRHLPHRSAKIILRRLSL